MQYTCQKERFLGRVFSVLDYDKLLIVSTLMKVNAFTHHRCAVQTLGGRKALPPCAKAFPTLPNFEVALDKGVRASVRLFLDQDIYNQ